MRLDLAQYRELVTFAQFGTEDLDAATRAQLERGQRATEILKQDQNKPLSMESQASIMYLLVNGYLDDVDVARVGAFESAFHDFMGSNHPQLLESIASEKSITDDIEASLKAAAEEFKATYRTRGTT